MYILLLSSLFLCITSSVRYARLRIICACDTDTFMLMQPLILSSAVVVWCYKAYGQSSFLVNTDSFVDACFRWLLTCSI